jgi:hypothetical protein
MVSLAALALLGLGAALMLPAGHTPQSAPASPGDVHCH